MYNIKKSRLIDKAKRDKFKWVSNIFLFLFFVGMVYIFIFPVLYMISVSVREPSSVQDPTVVWIPKELSLKSFKMTVEVMDYWNSLKLTLIIAVGGTIASLASCAMAGYGLARFKFKGAGLVFALVIITITLPSVSIMNASYLNFRYFNFGGLLKLFGVSINLLNTPWVFLLPALFGAGLRNGLFIFIFRQFFQDMPKELEEAAYIDGCGPFATFVRIMLPMSKSAFITVLLFSFIWHWNEYFMSALYFIEGTKPLSVMLESLQSMLTNSSSGAMGNVTSAYVLRTYLQAGSLLTILPPLVLYIFTQRQFTESIERTGIVG